MGNLKSGMKIKGILDIQMIDKDGKIVDSRHVENLIVTSGLSHLGALLGSGVATLSAGGYVGVKSLGLGNDNTAANTAQTNLISEIYREGATTGTLASSLITTVLTNDTLQFTLTVAAADAVGTWKEAALFAASTAQPCDDEYDGAPPEYPGVMINRLIFSDLVKTTSFTVLLTWKLVFADA